METGFFGNASRNQAPLVSDLLRYGPDATHLVIEKLDSWLGHFHPTPDHLVRIPSLINDSMELSDDRRGESTGEAQVSSPETFDQFTLAGVRGGKMLSVLPREPLCGPGNFPSKAEGA